MNLENLYDMVDKENIKLYDRYIDNAYGAFIHINDINAIIMNFKEIDSTAIEKATLAEELGHYYMDATYPFSCTDKTLIAKQEYRAKKWQFKALVSAKELSILAKKGYRYISEFAEELSVPEEIVERAYTYYKENNLIDIDKT